MLIIIAQNKLKVILKIRFLLTFSINIFHVFQTTQPDSHHIRYTVAFYEGLELSFVYVALTCSNAVLGLVLLTCDNNLAPSTPVAAFSKIK